MKRWAPVGVVVVSALAVAVAAGCKGGGASGKDAASQAPDGASDGDAAAPGSDGAAPGSDGASGDVPAAPDGGASDAPVVGAPDAGGGPDGAVVSTGSSRLCSDNGWCWVHPIPTGNDLKAILVRSPTDAWVAGTFGTLLHTDGTSWTQYHVLPDYIYGLAAEPSGTVWAVGSGGAARFDGHAFTSTPTGTDAVLHGVWAASATSAYAVGDNGTMLTWDGSAWTSTPLMMGVKAETRSLAAIWGSGPNDVWVGGSGGALWHKQVNNWGQMVGGSTDWTVIAGSAADNVWFANASGALYRWDGVTLQQARPAQTFTVGGIWVGSPTDVWVTRYQSVEHWDGTTWSSIALGYNMGALSGPSTTEVWGAGTGGNISRWNGRTWAPVVQSQLPYGVDVLWASGPSDVWMSSLQYLYHWDGQTVSRATIPGVHQIDGIWGSGPNNVWTAGVNGEVQHWDGTQWSLAVGTGTDELRAISGSGPNDVWVAGFYSAYHFNGTAWSKQTTGIEGVALWSVYTAGPTKAWAGASLDTLMRWDGTKWTQESSIPRSGFQAGMAVAGSGPTDVWALGSVPYHYDGQTWQALDVQGGGSLAWSAGPNDLWTMGGSYVSHYDGTSWTSIQPDASLPVALWGTAPNDVFVGGQGGLLRWTGTP
jgi:hypothetical protein